MRRTSDLGQRALVAPCWVEEGCGEARWLNHMHLEPLGRGMVRIDLIVDSRTQREVEQHSARLSSEEQEEPRESLVRMFRTMSMAVRYSNFGIRE